MLTLCYCLNLFSSSQKMQINKANKKLNTLRIAIKSSKQFHPPTWPPCSFVAHVFFYKVFQSCILTLYFINSFVCYKKGYIRHKKVIITIKKEPTYCNKREKPLDMFIPKKKSENLVSVSSKSKIPSQVTWNKTKVSKRTKEIRQDDKIEKIYRCAIYSVFLYQNCGAMSFSISAIRSWTAAFLPIYLPRAISLQSSRGQPSLSQTTKQPS